jgi:hypothetical protein
MRPQQPLDEDRKRGSPVPPPGPSLLSSLIRRGRPAYRPAPGIAVPRLEQVPGPDGVFVVPLELDEYRRTSDRQLEFKRRLGDEPLLRPRVARSLDHPESGAREIDFNRDELSELKALAAAALHDVAGRSQAAVQEWLSPEISNQRQCGIMAGVPADSHQGDTRSTRRRIERGRRLWVRLAAWPWWAVVDAGEDVAGGMPRRWWELPRVVDTHRVWLLLAADGTLS